MKWYHPVLYRSTPDPPPPPPTLDQGVPHLRPGPGVPPARVQHPTSRPGPGAPPPQDLDQWKAGGNYKTIKIVLETNWAFCFRIGSTFCLSPKTT